MSSKEATTDEQCDGEAGTPRDSRQRVTWTAEEDDHLMRLVQQHGPRNWSAISEALGGSQHRNGKSCRLRWCNQLDPSLRRSTFTSAEEEKILKLHQKYGNRWAAIAKELPGRTDNSIKNHWNSRLHKRAKERMQQQQQQGPDSPMPAAKRTRLHNSWPLDADDKRLHSSGAAALAGAPRLAPGTPGSGDPVCANSLDRLMQLSSVALLADQQLRVHGGGSGPVPVVVANSAPGALHPTVAPRPQPLFADKSAGLAPKWLMEIVQGKTTRPGRDANPSGSCDGSDGSADNTEVSGDTQRDHQQGHAPQEPSHPWGHTSQSSRRQRVKEPRMPALRGEKRAHASSGSESPERGCAEAPAAPAAAFPQNPAPLHALLPPQLAQLAQQQALVGSFPAAAGAGIGQVFFPPAAQGPQIHPALIAAYSSQQAQVQAMEAFMQMRYGGPQMGLPPATVGLEQAQSVVPSSLVLQQLQQFQYLQQLQMLACSVA